jgi:hypothetical protein
MEGQVIKLKEKLSLPKCKAALGKSKTKYTDAEILAIRDFLYELAEIDYSVFIHNDLKALEAENDNSENNDLQTAA